MSEEIHQDIFLKLVKWARNLGPGEAGACQPGRRDPVAVFLYHAGWKAALDP